MKRLKTSLPLIILVLSAAASISACYYVTILNGAVPVLENEEQR